MDYALQCLDHIILWKVLPHHLAEHIKKIMVKTPGTFYFDFFNFATIHFHEALLLETPKQVYTSRIPHLLKNPDCFTGHKQLWALTIICSNKNSQEKWLTGIIDHKIIDVEDHSIALKKFDEILASNFP